MSNQHPQPEATQTSPEVADLQREVQRLLGRCMLRLQQYEHLLKALVAHHELAGPADSIVQIREGRIQDVATKTLGVLIGKLLESYVVVSGAEREALDANGPATAIAFGFRSSLEMNAEDYARTRDSLKDLVELRNELQHRRFARLLRRCPSWPLHRRRRGAARHAWQNGYRTLERRVLERVLIQQAEAVIATGGGIVTDPSSYELVMRTCYTVWIHAKPEICFQRVQAQGDTRIAAPSLRRQAMDSIRRTMSARTDLYAAARLAVDPSALSVEEGAEGVLKALKAARRRGPT